MLQPPSTPYLIRPGVPALVLAPMEGVTDAPMRAVMTEYAPFTFCVSEFLRISQDVPGSRAYVDHVPELASKSVTPTGKPVQIQLLGGDPEKMAIAALRACELGSLGVDINFGCPAPTVNRHDGGATLLKFPDRIRTIVSAIRKAVPGHLPVSAKLRLGWDDIQAIHLNAERAAEGGASWITIHGRTRMAGYRPPIFWQPIGEVRARLASGGVPVVANGDIWSIDDFRICREQSGSEHFMLGRGALANPLLPYAVARELGLSTVVSAAPKLTRISNEEWIPLLKRFSALSSIYTEGTAGHHHTKKNRNYVVCRIKQWLKMAYLHGSLPCFDDIKKVETEAEIFEILARSS